MATARGTGSGKSRYVLLLIDFFNPDGFEPSGLAKAAVRAARRTAALKAGLPRNVQCIYVNDNFGNWRADFAAVVAACHARDDASARIAEALQPR